MKTILAIDTATGPCSVAVWQDGQLKAYAENTAPAMQSACLMPMVERALAQSGLDYGQLTAIACTTGPGSFTGIRVGLSAARGIALALGIPGLGFTTLEVMAFAARGEDNLPILALLNAGKGELYHQLFNRQPKWQPVFPARVAALSTISHAPCIVAGNVPMEFPGSVTSPVTFPRADGLAELAAALTNRAEALTPFYIRAPDAKLPVKRV